MIASLREAGERCPGDLINNDIQLHWIKEMRLYAFQTLSSAFPPFSIHSSFLYTATLQWPPSYLPHPF